MKLENKPNLFSFATSELSQDAFICWLLSWADIDNSKIDINLNKCAIRMIETFYELSSIQCPDLTKTITVEKQVENIDIVIGVGENDVIIIEDKTWTKNHSNQLERYLTKIKELKKEKTILPIYFTIGEQSDLTIVKDSNFKVFNRNEFLKVLQYGVDIGTKNEILIDFYEHLKLIDKRINDFNCVPIGEWLSGDSLWKGFFVKLQETFSDGGWDYVPNQSGGFMGFWWHSKFYNNLSECEQYLQLEQGKLCVKIYVENKSQRAEYRDIWHRRVIDNCQKQELDFIKPERFGSGTYMTVAVLRYTYLQKDESGMLDYKKTVELLKKAGKLIDIITT